MGRHKDQEFCTSVYRSEALVTIYRWMFIAYSPWVMALNPGSAEQNFPPPVSQEEYLHTRFMSYVSKSKERHKQQGECGDRPVCGKC